MSTYLAQLRDDLARKLAERKTFRSEAGVAGESFAEFFDRTKLRGWSTPEHIQKMAVQLQRVADGSLDRLRIHMPPRHGKTETATVRFPLYFLAQNPEASVLITSHTQQMANKFGMKTQNLWVKSGGRLDIRQQAYWTDGGRSLVARGVGSPPTGLGFDLIIIDDPIHSREEAESVIYRERAHAWYTDDILTRLEPGGRVVLICTRWHYDDLAARVAEGWESLVFPAISDDGEPLWAERYPLEELNRIRDEMRRTWGDYSFESLYQQNPAPREGAHFELDRIEYVDEVQPVDVCRGWDLAATKGSGDFTVGVKLGRLESGEFVVLDVQRGQWSAHDVEQRIAATAAMDGPECAIALPIDPGQAGKAQARRMQNLLAAYPTRCQPVRGSKIARSQPLAAAIGAGNLKIVRASWTASLVEELRQFPFGKHDDQVDALTEAYNRLADGARLSWEVF